MFAAFIWAVVCVTDKLALEVFFAFKSLIDSLAHHSEREMIVTHGKFHSLAKEKLKTVIHSNISTQSIFL